MLSMFHNTCLNFIFNLALSMHMVFPAFFSSFTWEPLRHACVAQCEKPLNHYYFLLSSILKSALLSLIWYHYYYAPLYSRFYNAMKIPFTKLLSIFSPMDTRNAERRKRKTFFHVEAVNYFFFLSPYALSLFPFSLARVGKILTFH